MTNIKFRISLWVCQQNLTSICIIFTPLPNLVLSLSACSNPVLSFYLVWQLQRIPIDCKRTRQKVFSTTFILPSLWERKPMHSKARFLIRVSYLNKMATSLQRTLVEDNLEVDLSSTYFKGKRKQSQLRHLNLHKKCQWHKKITVFFSPPFSANIIPLSSALPWLYKIVLCC